MAGTSIWSTPGIAGIKEGMKHLGRRVAIAVGWTVLTLVWAWSIPAILLGGGNGSPGPVRMILSAVAFLVAGVALYRLPRRAAAAVLVAHCALVLTWWTMLEPSHERRWSATQARLPRAEIDGPRVTLHNIRNFRYRTPKDWDEDFYDATFDTRDLQGVDFIVSHFSDVAGVAHTMVSFRFAGERFVSISVEVRNERDETYSPLRGLFRQYELMYVVGDERDLVALRAVHRQEDVYVFPVNAPRDRLTAFFLGMVQRVNALAQRPEFYNTVFSSCTSNLVTHLEEVRQVSLGFDHRIVLPGYSDELAYELGLIDNRISLEEARRRYRINERALEDGGSERFSLAIRHRRQPL